MTAPSVSNTVITDKAITDNKNHLDDVVLFEKIATKSGHILGIMTLNSPKSLNALSAEMCQLLSAALTDWQDEDRMVAVVLKGAGDKAFCAGGDIRKLYDSMTDNAQFPNPYATEFFGSEYHLFQQMHGFTKPIILWSDGIVMGGGMGLLASCSHRIVTAKTQFAMPEVSIGLFPDASGSWFLQKFPAKTGLFLGLTGARGSAGDLILGNLAEFALACSYKEVMTQLIAADWQRATDPSCSDTASDIVNRALSQLPKAELIESKLERYWQPISQMMNSGSLDDIDAILQNDDKIAAISSDFAQDDWSKRAIDTYRKGCPVTKALAFELYHKVAILSFDQILYLETNVALHCAANPDFKEGVRALLIDKDKRPKWSRSLKDCLSIEGRRYIDRHFVSPYAKGEHPILVR